MKGKIESGQLCTVGLARIRSLGNVLKLKTKGVFMQVTTVEGIVKNGQIHLTEEIKLPEMAKVYVVVPNLERKTAKIMSPRLVDKTRLKDFEREIIEIEDDEI